MKATTRTLLALAIALTFVTTFSLSSYAQTRITQQIDDSQAVRMARNTRPEANFKNDRGAVSDSFDAEHMFLLLQRSPAQEAKLNKLIDQLNDKKSPNFHKWLTPEQLGQRFGVSQQDIDTVVGWLEYHGFRVNRVYTNRILIDFSGTAGQLREAFHTSIHQLDVKGAQHIANMNDPMIPAALAPVVKGIVSLNDFRPEAMHKVAPPQYTTSGCATSTQPTFPGTCYFITPQDDAVIYNLNPLWTAGITGAGQTIAVVEDTDTYNGTADWSTYMSTFGLSGYGGTYTQVHPGGCTDPGTTGDDGEAALDAGERRGALLYQSRKERRQLGLLDVVEQGVVARSLRHVARIGARPNVRRRAAARDGRVDLHGHPVHGVGQRDRLRPTARMRRRHDALAQ